MISIPDVWLNRLPAAVNAGEKKKKRGGKRGERKGNPLIQEARNKRGNSGIADKALMAARTQ